MKADPHHDSDFPEVANIDSPHAIPREAEGLQAVRQDWDKEQPYRTGVEAHGQEQGRKPSMTRTRWIMVAVVSICIALAVGLGAGLGVGLSSGSDMSDGSKSQSDSNPPTTVTLSTSPPASTTCSGVTSGRTGIACVSCNQTNPDVPGYTTSNQAFREVCNTDMSIGTFGYNATSNSASSEYVQDISIVISYSFTDCMDQCAIYNQKYGTDGDDYPCQAVTFGANLTQALVAQEQDGNCWLKDRRGIGRVDNSGLVMSAFLVST